MNDQDRISGSWVARAGAALLLAMVCAAAVRAQAPDFSKVEFRSEKLAENLHVLFGAGGNIAVLSGPEGALLVDSEVVELSPKLRAAVMMLTEKPARFVVNTHFHFDHAGGNPSLGRGGAVILAHENVRKHLMTRQVVNVGVEIVTEPTPPAGLPVVTFEAGVRLHLNGQDVLVQHASHAHTDSDALVFFEQANVLHTGDVFISLGYPFIDAGNGGSLDGVIAAHVRALALCNERTRVVPGHGPVVGKAELQAYHDMLVTVRQRVQDLVRKRRSVDQVLAAAPSREFDERWGKGFISPAVFIQRVFIEANRPKKKG
jgi:cyclase